jgi:hypothetical protein
MLYEGEFDSGTVRLWTGIGTLTWNGLEWTGAGNLLDITPIEETRDTRAIGIGVSLNGISSEIIALVLAHARLKKRGTIYFACLSNGAVVADPIIAYRGFLDVPQIEDFGDKCNVTVTYESELIDLQRARVRRYTDNDQKLDYPSDKGFAYVAELQDREVLWGGNPVPLRLPLKPKPPIPPYSAPYNPYSPNNAASNRGSNGVTYPSLGGTSRSV